MIKKLIILIFSLVGGSVGFNYLPDLLDYFSWTPNFLINSWIGLILGLILGIVLGILFAPPLEKMYSKTLKKISEWSITKIIYGGIGLLVGLIIGWLINLPLVAFSLPIISDVLPIILTLFLAIIGFQVGSTRYEDIKGLFARSEKEDGKILQQNVNDKVTQYKVLDTSVIIDGRILDVIRTGFLEGIFIVSDHVLKELQYIADSSDSLKRERGRRGLDILNELQRDSGITIEINHDEIPEAEDTDIKLLYLAKNLGGSVVTNDFNLNKVAEFQNVHVLNVNELASVVKPVVIPGEEMQVVIVKSGTERNQGVAYLDDGTMVVVEEGKNHLNKKVSVVVTSSLQTNAGRMIFADMASAKNRLEQGKQ